MSKAENLLNGLSEEEIAAYTVNPETEPHIVIGDDREISVPSELRRIAVQYDHNIETVTFDCPRYWDEHDMSTMKVYINYMRPDGKKGSYIATDISVDTTDENIMHFNWTVNKHVTMVNGNLKFLVCIKKVNNDGNEENHWNSELCDQMTISEGLECAVSFDDDYPDLYTQLVNLIEDKVDKVEGKDLSTNDYTTAEKTKLAGIETGANKTVVDSTLSDTSTNPVQNKIINAKFKANDSVVAGLSTSLQTAYDTLNTKVDSEYLANYVPKSGATFDKDADITFNRTSDNRSTKYDTEVRFFSASDKQIASGLYYYGYDDTEKSNLFGNIGAIYNTNEIIKYYMGPSSSNTIFEMLPNGDATFKGVVNAAGYNNPLSGVLLGEDSSSTTDITIPISNLNKYSLILVITRGVGIVGKTSGTSNIIPLNYLRAGNELVMYGGVPSSTYTTSEGPLAINGMSGSITASISSTGDSITLVQSVGSIGNVFVYSIF